MTYACRWMIITGCERESTFDEMLHRFNLLYEYDKGI